MLQVDSVTPISAVTAPGAASEISAMQRDSDLHADFHREPSSHQAALHPQEFIAVTIPAGAIAPSVEAEAEQSRTRSRSDSMPALKEREASFLSKQNVNDGKQVEDVIERLSVKKSHTPWHKELFLAWLAGVWVGLSGIVSQCAAGGIALETRLAYPMIPKFLLAITFPMAIVYIVLFGGSLFTGNQMYMFIGVLQRKVTPLDLLKNWLIVLTGNAVGCLCMAYFFSYLTGYMEAEPYLSYVVGIANYKANLEWGVAFLRAIPCNMMVCMSILLGLSARDMIGKIAALWFPIFAFAMAGFEHCVANVFFFSVGKLYGAEASIGHFIAFNLIPVILGNIVGGAILIGGSELYLHKWSEGITFHDHHGKHSDSNAHSYSPMNWRMHHAHSSVKRIKSATTDAHDAENGHIHPSVCTCSCGVHHPAQSQNNVHFSSHTQQHSNAFDGGIKRA